MVPDLVKVIKCLNILWPYNYQIIYFTVQNEEHFTADFHLIKHLE